MIRKISIFLQKYKSERELIESKLSFKEILLFTIYSVIVNIFIYLIPTLLIYNFFILDKIMLFLKFLIILLIILFTITYNYFFVVFAKSKKEILRERKFKHLIIFESITFSLVLVIITIIIFTIV